MSMEDFLNDRDRQAERSATMAKRDAAAREWLDQSAPPEVRLLKFDTWARAELALHIDWTWAGDVRARRIEQCRKELETLVLALWRRGWMLDGKRLAAHITAALQEIGDAQKAGRIRDFWMFFKTVVNRYVGTNAEEIQAEAMSMHAAVSQVFDQLTKKTKSLPELMAQRAQEEAVATAESLRQKAARVRAAEAQKAADAAQPKLF